MKIRKLLAGMLSLAILSLSVPVFGQDILAQPVLGDEMPISEEVEDFKFESFGAKVETVTKEEQYTMLNVTDSSGQEANVMVFPETFVQGAEEITKGDKITVYYNAAGPMLAIYPPQYKAEVVVVESEDTQVAVDIFSSDLVSSSNSLQLNIADDTVVVDVSGNVFEGELAGNKLVVLYTASTKSIPALTTPSKVIVLNDNEVSVKEDIFDKNLLSSDGELKLNVGKETIIVDQDGNPYKGDIAGKRLRVTYSIVTMSIPPQTPPIKIVVLEDRETSGFPDVTNMDLAVGGRIIENTSSYNKNDANNTVMVPLRAVAEELGLEVKWEDKVSGIMVGGHGSMLNLGDKVYTYLKTAPITLDVAPELKDGVTYVPLNYFTEVLKMNNAYVFEGQIVIDNEEKMN